MHVLLLTGSPETADLVRQPFVDAVPDCTLEVCTPPAHAADSLTTHPDTRAVVIATDLTGIDAGASSIAAVRAVSATVPVVALVAAGDGRGEARALLAGADAVLAADEMTAPGLAALLSAIPPHATQPDVREWRLLFAGRDSDLRRAVAQSLGSRVVLMSLSADGRLVPIIDRPGGATALVVDARDDAEGMLLGLRQTRRAFPSLPTIAVCDERFHAVFVREGVDACAASDVTTPRLLQTVADACEARRAVAELDSLRARESRMRALVEHLPDPVLLVGVDRTVSAVNLAGLDVLGTADARDVIGLPVTDWLDAEAGDLGTFIDGVVAGNASAVVARTPRGTVRRELLLRAVPFQRDPDRPASALITLREAAPAVPAPPVPIAPAPEPTVNQAELDEATLALDAALVRVAQLEDQALAQAATMDAELLAAGERAQYLEAALEEARTELVGLRDRPATLDTHVDEETRWLLYEVAAIGHITTTADARILGANDIAARLLGHFSGDALQASGQLPAPILRAAGAFDQRPTRFEVCLQHGEDGPLHWLVGLATPHAGVPATVTWMLLDVTEQRLQARRTRFLRRMDGLTHVLSAASAESTTLVGRAIPLLDAAADALARRDDLDVTGTRTSLARTQAVLTQLSGYARRRARRETVHDLREIIDTASAVLVHLAGEDITCSISHADEPLHATLEPAEFQPLLTSLVMAGREALPLGGHLSLTTQAMHTDAGTGGTFFMRPSIEMTLLAEGYGAQRPEGLQSLEDSASRQGGTLVTTADDRGEVRWVLRLARVFVTP